MLGIGIITYNRSKNLYNCISQIQKYTKNDSYNIVVADDGSSDNTVQVCKDLNVSVITGKNKGVCWNKNRVLYYFMEYSNLNKFILLEDDCEPYKNDWVNQWIDSIGKWDHINYADMDVSHGDKKFKDFVVSGDGSPEKPFCSKLLTGSCTGCSRESIKKIGYLNTLFTGYGYGHVEWTNRFLHQNIGKHTDDTERLFRCIVGGIKNNREKTWRNSDQLLKNKYIYDILSSCKEIKNRFVLPWIEETEKKTFIEEIENIYVAK